jgi:hypothetical protein
MAWKGTAAEITGVIVSLSVVSAPPQKKVGATATAAPTGIYFDISRCHACAYENWQREVDAAFVVAGLRAFPGSATVVNQNVTGIVRKNSAEEWFESVFVGPYGSESEAQAATNRLLAVLGSISKRLGEGTGLERGQSFVFKVGDFEVVMRDLRSAAQRESESTRNSAAQNRPTPSGCSFITPIEATAVLGVGATNKGKCEYASRDGLRTFSIETASTNILNQTASQIFAEERSLMGGLGGQLRDEPSLGSAAFSCVWSDHEGGRSSAIVVLKAVRVLIAIVAEKQPGSRDLTTQFVDRLRPILRRVALGL